MKTPPARSARAGLAWGLALTVLASAAPTKAAPALPASPWQGNPSLAPGHVPPVVVAVWEKAPNRQTCALLALGPDQTPDATREPPPRRANFYGGWAVAYDVPPAERSAWGVAGTGARVADDTSYEGWPNHRVWSDGSRLDYGPESSAGPKWLAYLTVAGQGCLYNVWSGRGRRHLETLVERLRFVDGHGSRGP